jgi:hypothetical protein
LVMVLLFSKLSTMSFPCIVCEQNVRPKQHALECDSCFQWQHRLCNTGMYKQYLKSLNRNIKMFLDYRKIVNVFSVFWLLHLMVAIIKTFQVLFIGILLKANGINIMNTMLCFWIRFNIGGFCCWKLF